MFTLKMEATRCSETFVTTYKTTQCHNLGEYPWRYCAVDLFVSTNGDRKAGYLSRYND